MQVLNKDTVGEEKHLRLDNLDDLWHLHTLIEARDGVISITKRREDDQADRVRADKGKRVIMRLLIQVEWTEFHEFSLRLRVHGTIEEGPAQLGSHHTFNFTEGDELTLIKSQWKNHHIEILKQAVEMASLPRVIMVAIEDDNATIAVLRNYGVQVIAEIAGPTSGKQYRGKKGAGKAAATEFFQEIILQVSEQAGNSQKQVPLIILGPGFTKEHFLRFGRKKYPDLFDVAVAMSTGQAGVTGINELLKHGLPEDIEHESRVERETQLVDRLLSQIQKNGLATYGIEHIRLAINLGAVEDLLVIDNKIKDQAIQELASAAEDQNAMVHVISTVHESGKQLEALGGLGALLRFQIG